MSSIDDLPKAIPMDGLAAQLGTDRKTTQQAARIAMPTLLGGVDLGGGRR